MKKTLWLVVLIVLSVISVSIETAAQTVGNGRIAFVRDGEIYSADDSGTNALNLTNNTANDSQPSYSPDGTKITFISNRDGNNEIYVMNQNGSNPVRLTTTAAQESAPAFSPDGTKIVYASGSGSDSEIYTININGTNPIRLTNNAVVDAQPKFSPNGGKIVFIRVYQNQQGLSLAGVFTMNTDGSNAVQLTTGTTINDASPSFSPDGTKIIFRRFDNGSFVSSISTVNPDGSGITNVLSNTSSQVLHSPSFSPDGTRILYCFQTQANPEVFRVSILNTATGFNNGSEPTWQPLRANTRPNPDFDYDGDGKADISVFRPSNGTWYLQQSLNGLRIAQFGQNGDRIMPGDYDGDGITDIAVFRRGADSTWYILQSSNNLFRAVRWGASNLEQAILFDTPVPADYDGDGKTDIAIWRLTDNLSEPGRFLILQSSNGAVRDQIFGNSSDRAVPGDYDGDQSADLAVYRGGTWYIQQSSNNSLRVTQFGLNTDKVVPADYDGDGKTDLGVYRPSNGSWYLLNSLNNEFTATQFGTAEDKPAPADFDGDGKADITVFRPTGGNWYSLRSTNGFTATQFGTTEDVPTPNAFVR